MDTKVNTAQTERIKLAVNNLTQGGAQVEITLPLTTIALQGHD